MSKKYGYYLINFINLMAIDWFYWNLSNFLIANEIRDSSLKRHKRSRVSAETLTRAQLAWNVINDHAFSAAPRSPDYVFKVSK